MIIKKTDQIKDTDLVQEFAEWLFENGPKTYKDYYGTSVDEIIIKLNEINSFFDINIFDANVESYQNLKAYLSKNIYGENRRKNDLFFDYDALKGNGRPKAIIGKQNYFKFLEKSFEASKINYWIFQGNPKVFDFEAAIADDSLDDFTVSAHKDKIKVGDKVIIWLAGDRAGCYALAEIISKPEKISVGRDDKRWKLENPNDIKAGIKITHNLLNKPILWDEIKEIEAFENFKGGNPGSNFSSTKEEYLKLLDMAETNNIQYWLYSPGRNAEHWDAFYNEGIMAIGWDALGDLSQYKNKDEIFNALKTNYGGEGNKKNNVTANYEFANTINRGDIIIVKRGSSELLGYGEVASDYFFDAKRLDYRSCRKVDWILKGNWKTSLGLVHKTLTDITRYASDRPQYDFYYQILMGVMDNDIKEKISKSKPMSAINQILYGPPGTGKTFFLKDQLFDTYTIKETSISKEKYFEDTVANLTWWQVTAIALIEKGTSRVNAIIENRWVSKKSSLSESKNVRATIWGTLQMHTIAESQTVAYTQRQVPLIFDKNEDKSWQLIESELKEQAPELYEILDSVNNFKANPNTIIKHYDFVTFHQSFAYEDFIEGIKPILPVLDGEESKDLGYTIEDGVFKNLCSKADKDPENRYAIFIDEINRGNVSAIFGELITLIETDKRLGAKNELKIKLPYSKKEFGVPSNVDIYGTMNTADRSVEALDTALRRRFEFKEMMPDYAVLQNEFVDGIKLSKVLQIINERIELLIDRDHTIGHSYFVNVNTTEKLANAFNNKIVPLLQEYFYGDYGKIGLVLGKGFVGKIKNDTIEFASFDYENANDFKTPTFVLNQVGSSSIIEAVTILLGKKDLQEAE